MGGKHDQSVRSDWLTRTPKWVLLGGFWIVQGVVLYALSLFLMNSQADIEDSLLGRWVPSDEYLNSFFSLEVAIWLGGSIALLSIAQMIFMLPMRKPGMTAGHGRSLRKSLVIAAAAISVLLLAAVLGILGFAFEVLGLQWEVSYTLPGEPLASLGILFILGWLIATPLLYRFTKPGRKETVLARLSKKLFLGTIIEVALLIPLDVMIRRKADCYCMAGTYLALTLCGFIGVFALGPAVFLPILAKRRKTWYNGHCGVCSYDMSGTPDALRCPECGTGWKNDRPKPTIETQ